MELCYEGALVMPKNCIKVTEAEMTYIEAGWSGDIFSNNLKGLAHRYSGAMRASGASVYLAACATWSYGAAVAYLGMPMITFASIAGPAVFTLIGLIAYTAITVLGTWRLFY